MDKLLCTLGMGLLVGIIRVKEWAEGAAELVKGTDGFILMLGICIVSLALVSLLMLTGRRKHIRESV